MSWFQIMGETLLRIEKQLSEIIDLQKQILTSNQNPAYTINNQSQGGSNEQPVYPHVARN